MVSTRRSRPESTYQVGDTVEVSRWHDSMKCLVLYLFDSGPLWNALLTRLRLQVVRGRGIGTGKLLQRIKGEASAVHWIVSIDNTEVDVSEHFLGRIVTTVTDEEDEVSKGSDPSVTAEGVKPKRAKTRKSPKKTVHKRSRSPTSVTSNSSSSKGVKHTTRATGRGQPLLKGVEHIVIEPKKKDDPFCEKVVMRTGTLYLYRDGRPVKFVRSK